MKKHNGFSLAYQLASPVALIAVGLLLMINPDFASALAARFLGWTAFLVGLGFGIAAVVSKHGTVSKVLTAATCLGIGGWLVRNPLVLAAGAGRLLGIVLLIRGGRDLLRSGSRGSGKVLAVITIVTGVVLTVLPMTTSRVVFSLCGVVIGLIGLAMLLERLKNYRNPEDYDPNIIDAL